MPQAPLSAHRTERGAALVEFALIGTLLFALIMGIIDFGWAYSQYLSVKHAAREGARLASVNAETTAATTAGRCTNLVTLVKARVSNELGSGLTVSLSSTGAVGDTASITVTYPRSSITGFTKALAGGTMSSTVQFRMEQISDWGTTCNG